MENNNEYSEENKNTQEDLNIEETSADESTIEGTEDESEETSADETKDKKSETVSLNKYMKLKKKLKAKEKQEAQISEKDLETLKKIREENERKEFEKAFDEEFDKVVKLYPEVADKRDSVLALSITDKFKDNTLEEIVQTTFEGLISKVSTEDETGSAGEGVDEKIDFANASEEQLGRVMKDPEARKKYLSWKVEQN